MLEIVTSLPFVMLSLSPVFSLIIIETTCTRAKFRRGSLMVNLFCSKISFNGIFTGYLTVLLLPLQLVMSDVYRLGVLSVHVSSKNMHKTFEIYACA